MSAALLDTCAILWLGAGIPPTTPAGDTIEAARRDDAVLVSPISALGKTAQKRERRPADLALPVAPFTVWRRFADQPGVRTTPLTADILVASVAIDGL